MAIWPFGRSNKAKRHTIQVSPDEAATLQSSIANDPRAAAAAIGIEPTLGRKPSLRPSKRQNSNRLSRNGDEVGSVHAGLGRSSSQRQRPTSFIDHRSQMSSDRADPDGPQRPLSRTESLMRTKNQNGPNKLRRRLSKRKAHEIMREREIRMLSSTPIDIPRRTGQSDYNMMDHRRRKTNGQRLNRYQSDVSLSVRDSAASSMSDLTDPYTFKVNAFAALTPRPVVRYVEAPRAPTARNNPPKDRLQNLTTSEEDLYYSKRRVNELADSLDANTLRELMDRDRRRREKKQIDDQERLRRKLQARADAQQAQEARGAEEAVAAAAAARDLAAVENHHEPAMEETVDADVDEERGVPKESDAAGADSIADSVPIIENTGESSIREPKLATRSSFAPSHEMGMSRTTLSPSHSSVRHGLSSPSHSQTFGMGSNSDLSERRLSDTSGRRGNTITHLFRRDPVLPSSAVSYSPRAFIPTGTVKRAQSKFTEHFGDEPMSPPDSRLQSPDIPEEVPESSLEHDQDTFLQGPTPSASMDIINPRRRHHLSLAESFDAESDNIPLSQSLASIDSEGSWMSGQIFRRMHQKPSSPVRNTMSPLGPANLEDPDVFVEARESLDSQGASSNVMGDPEMDNEMASPETGNPAEMWHSELGRRPVVVNPVARPKSNQGMLRCVPSLSPISAEEDYSPVSPLEEDNFPGNFPQRVASVHGIIDHV
ncbi:hypothetical protein N7494_003796 [Penicillium frequentans]|uniref:Uncharacterized protein n=1 Tax=Penicillium frequentans TaxID=3151616 RepID=A0AAD6GHR5_9EURO|nr:hypothetical protein N7494_003796 [Penicillium glabrum]